MRKSAFSGRSSDPEAESPHNLLKNTSFNYSDALQSVNGDLGFAGNDRRFAYSRQSSFQQPPAEPWTPPSTVISGNRSKHVYSRSVSSIDIPPAIYPGSVNDILWNESGTFPEKFAIMDMFLSAFRMIRSGNRYMKRLFLLISLNVAYSTAELFIGLLSGRVGLVSDAFHLTFGCGLLTFSLFAMGASRKKPDHVYTYGYKRLEVLAAFTNALFLLFLSFSLAVEALHAFIQDESEHKHYLIASAVTNLLVNLIGVWFFRGYARRTLDSAFHFENKSRAEVGSMKQSTHTRMMGNDITIEITSRIRFISNLKMNQIQPEAGKDKYTYNFPSFFLRFHHENNGKHHNLAM